MAVTNGITKSSTLAVLLVAMMVFSSGCKLASAFELVSLTYYLHDDFVPPDVTGVQVASADGNFTGTLKFGDITAFDSPLLASIEPNSTQIGWGSGLLVSLKNPSLSFITFSQQLDIGNFSGTVSASGRFNNTKPSWDVACTGGTGSFINAGGWFVVTVVDPNPLGIIVKYEAFLKLES